MFLLSPNRGEESDPILTSLTDLCDEIGWLYCLLRLVLTGRQLNISTKDLPSGGHQGTILGLFIFIIIFNGAGPPISSLTEHIIPPSNHRQPIPAKKTKFIDYPVEFSLSYHNRTQHYLKAHRNRLQNDANQLMEYAPNNLVNPSEKGDDIQ